MFHWTAGQFAKAHFRVNLVHGAPQVGPRPQKVIHFRDFVPDLEGLSANGLGPRPAGEGTGACVLVRSRPEHSSNWGRENAAAARTTEILSRLPIAIAASDLIGVEEADRNVDRDDFRTRLIVGYFIERRRLMDETTSSFIGDNRPSARRAVNSDDPLHMHIPSQFAGSREALGATGVS